jgi:hypothetical protein
MIDYSEGIFTRTFTQDNKKFYATFHPEVIVDRENYELTGRYLVVLLDPEKGLQSFYLNKNDDSNTWKLEETSSSIIDDDMLEWCNHQIQTQREKKNNG